MIYRLCRIFFALCIARPVALICLGLHIRNKQNIQWDKPCIIAANHNSHLDTLVLLSMVPLRHIHKVHPAAATDYFLSNPFIAWLSRHFLGIIGVARNLSGQHPLTECQLALEKEHTIILFPEGTRGEPEKMQTIKSGIAYLAKQFPHIPVTPVFMHGLGRALPKGEWLVIPFFCDAYVGEHLRWQGNKNYFIEKLTNQFCSLRAKLPAKWMKTN